MLVKVPTLTPNPVRGVLCSLYDPAQSHRRWALALVTRPESVDHAVVLGRTGDCRTCFSDLVEEAEKIPLPCEIIEADDPDGDFCQCEGCKWINGWISGAVNTHKKNQEVR